jgi:hypothetical protein
MGNLGSLRSLEICFDTDALIADFAFPASMAHLQLTTLSLTGMEQRSFLPLLTVQHHLIDLTLMNCDLTEIPSEIFLCRHLERLDLSNNMIEAVSPHIQRLTFLENLDLFNNLIRHLEDALFNLNGDCEVLLDENRLDAAELRRLEDFTQNEDYRGPGFITDDHGYVFVSSDEEAEESAEEQEPFNHMISGFYTALGQPRPDFIDHLAQDEATTHAFSALLSQLLRRIPSQHTFAPGVYASLSRSIELAAHNLDYRQKCVQLIQGATETCGDGIIAIILRLSLARQEVSLDLANPAQVFEFILKGKLAMTLLEKRASHEVVRQKIEIISSIRQAHPLMNQEQINQLAQQSYENEIDPVEIYLAYPIFLCHRLHLPLEIDRMFFQLHARISADEFEAAAIEVEQRLQDKSFVLSVLTEDDLWLNLLEQQYPEAFRELAAEKERLADLPEEPSAAAEMDPYLAFYEKKNKTLLELSSIVYGRLQDALVGKDLAPEVKRSRKK